MTALMINMAEQRSKELRDYAEARRLTGRRRRKRPAGPGGGLLAQLSIRRLGDADAEALDRVAGRDSARRPTGELIGAELDGRLIAAISVTTGEVVADPFTPTEEARSLLARRAAQLREGRAHHGHRDRHHSLRGRAARPRRG